MAPTAPSPGEAIPSIPIFWISKHRTNTFTDQTFQMAMDARPGHFVSGQDQCSDQHDMDGGQQDDHWALDFQTPFECARLDPPASHLAPGGAFSQGFPPGFDPAQGLPQALPYGSWFSTPLVGEQAYSSGLNEFSSASPVVSSGMRPWGSSPFSVAGTSAHAPAQFTGSDIDESGNPRDPFNGSPFQGFSLDGAQTDVSASSSQSINAHVCQWQLDDNKACGERFDSSASLHAHVAVVHITTMEQTTEHGFLCRWTGCDRLTDRTPRAKKGFDTKSKVRRHIETHTGPRESLACCDTCLELTRQ